MSKFVTVLKVAGAIIGIVLAGFVLGWLGSGGPMSTTPPANPATASLDSAPVDSSPAPVTGPSASPTVETRSKAEPAAVPANLITNWGDKVDEILASEDTDSNKARQMLELLPQLSEEGQTAVAQYASNLLPDQDAALLKNYVTNSTLPESVLDVLEKGLLERPNTVKLPMLLEVARSDQNPKAAEARELLHAFLDEDYGNDWNQWQTKIDQWVRENPN